MGNSNFRLDKINLSVIIRFDHLNEVNCAITNAAEVSVTRGPAENTLDEFVCLRALFMHTDVVYLLF